APKKGIVVYSPDWNGRKKAVGDRCWMGSAIMELPNLEKMDVAIVIPEPVAGKVKEGLAAEIRLDSNPDRIFKGKVKELGRIFRAKSHEQPAVVFDAKISIDDPDTDSMRPGMAASVDIIINSRKNVLQVPEAAIVYGPKGAHVMKETFTGSKMVPVFIGASSGGMVEILEGLKEDDTVIIPEKGNGENQ
ncbi:MAG: HlyD family efflux transporter periplasmic adaptor subunit, partial [bacterium]|nr:HlyD family efflux transporter periplasmic adaptor subunit [bacterium]